jgi:hypothetical protein
LRYSVSGQGSQVINLGFDPDHGQLDVILNGNFVARNQGWTKDDDGTIKITGSYQNVTLWYIAHPEPSENTSYLNEHYILVGSTGFLTVTVILAAIFKHRKKEAEKQLNTTYITSNSQQVKGDQ